MVIKRRICRAFGTASGCIWGLNCNFIHPGSDPWVILSSNLGDVIGTINLDSATHDLFTMDTTDLGRAAVASFNWMKGTSNIAVPGLLQMSI